MNGPAFLFLAAALSLPSTTIVLRSGEHIVTDGPIRQENSRIVFREPGGSLYSIALDDIDLDATRQAPLASGATISVVAQPDAAWRTTSQARPATGVADSMRLAIRVSKAERERLLHELEKNHEGKSAPPVQFERVLPPPSPVEARAAQDDEWSWRNRARQYQEQGRQARENLSLALERIDTLKDQIRGFFNLGYNASSFTYQTTQLQETTDQIPYLQLEVKRAQRAYDQFRDDARKQDVNPDWLR